MGKAIRKGVFLCSVVALSVGLTAQDASIVRPPRPVDMLPHGRRPICFDVTHNVWLQRPDSITSELFSGGFTVSLHYDLFFIKRRLSLAPGVALAVSSVKTNAFPQELPTMGSMHVFTHLQPFAGDSLQIRKNKIAASYLEIPIELRWFVERGDKPSIWFAAGLRVGRHLSDHWKWKFEDPQGRLRKQKTYNLANVADWRSMVHVRLVYGRVGFLGAYALNEFFEKDAGTPLTPAAFGLTFAL